MLVRLISNMHKETWDIANHLLREMMMSCALFKITAHHSAQTGPKATRRLPTKNKNPILFLCAFYVSLCWRSTQKTLRHSDVACKNTFYRYRRSLYEDISPNLVFSLHASAFQNRNRALQYMSTNAIVLR